MMAAYDYALIASRTYKSWDRRTARLTAALKAAKEEGASYDSATSILPLAAIESDGIYMQARDASSVVGLITHWPCRSIAGIFFENHPAAGRAVFRLNERLAPKTSTYLRETGLAVPTGVSGFWAPTEAGHAVLRIHPGLHRNVPDLLEAAIVHREPAALESVYLGPYSYNLRWTRVVQHAYEEAGLTSPYGAMRRPTLKSLAEVWSAYSTCSVTEQMKIATFLDPSLSLYSNVKWPSRDARESNVVNWLRGLTGGNIRLATKHYGWYLPYHEYAKRWWHLV